MILEGLQTQPYHWLVVKPSKTLESEDSVKATVPPSRSSKFHAHFKAHKGTTPLPPKCFGMSFG